MEKGKQTHYSMGSYVELDSRGALAGIMCPLREDPGGLPKDPSRKGWGCPLWNVVSVLSDHYYLPSVFLPGLYCLGIRLDWSCKTVFHRAVPQGNCWEAEPSFYLSRGLQSQACPSLWAALLGAKETQRETLFLLHSPGATAVPRQICWFRRRVFLNMTKAVIECDSFVKSSDMILSNNA